MALQVYRIDRSFIGCVGHFFKKPDLPIMTGAAAVFGTFGHIAQVFMEVNTENCYILTEEDEIKRFRNPLDASLLDDVYYIRHPKKARTDCLISSVACWPKKDRETSVFSTHLKTVLIAAVIVSLPIPTLAEVKKEGVGGRYNQLVSTELQAILKTAGAGEGYKLEGKKMNLEGWLAAVDTTKANDGTTLYILQIAEKFNIDFPFRPNSANPDDNLSFFCVTADRVAVQKLDKNKLVAFSAEIREIKAGSYKADYGTTSSGTRMTATVKQKAVLAKCDFKAAPKEQPTEPLKASRATETGVSGALATASLCDPGEGIVFACNTGKKSVSVCASAKGVQYRFGVDRNSLDISLDAKGAGAGEYPLAGGGVWYYRFNNGNTSYVVYTAESSSMDKAGLVVEQGGKRTASLTCKNAATTNPGLAGVAADTKGFEVP